MKRIYNNYFLVGLFTIVVGGAAIVLLLNMSGKNKDADSYYSYFDNVTGLGYGNPVYYQGYRVGQVENITPETKDGKLLFKTEYTLLSGWKVPSDSMAKIESSGLLSDMSLSIHAGKSTSHLDLNSEIKGVKGDDIMATMTQLAHDFGALNDEKIRPLMDLIYTRTDNLTKSLETQIPEILTSIEGLVKNIDKLIVSADKLLGDENIEGIETIINNLEKLSTQLSESGGWVESSLDNVNKLIASGDDMIKHSDEKIVSILDITLKMLESFSVKAETIGSEIESASMNINEATNSIRKKPSTLIFSEKTKIADEDL